MVHVTCTSWELVSFFKIIARTTFIILRYKEHTKFEYAFISDKDSGRPYHQGEMVPGSQSC